MTLRPTLLLALACVAGCRTTTHPPLDSTPLPAEGTLETAGGYLLAVDADGALLATPPSGDVEASLGVTLREEGDLVRVDGLLRADTPLRPGDVLQRVSSTNPEPTDADDFADHWPRLWTAVTSVADLRGYGLAWNLLDVEVRRGEAVETLELELGRPELLPVRPWRPDATRELGVTLCDVRTLPEHLRPALATELQGREVLLVTYVATGSPLGIAGLRPLQLVTARERKDGLELTPLRTSNVDRTFELEEYDASREDTTVLYGLARVQDDPRQTTVHVVLDGWLFAFNRQLLYNPRLDRYVTSQGWSTVGGLLMARSSQDGAGRGDSGYLNIGPFVPVDPEISPNQDGSLLTTPAFAFDEYEWNRER
ncbi:MAG: hypothetical protein R3F62_15765 [Planctomycetota bacterium]